MSIFGFWRVRYLEWGLIMNVNLQAGLSLKSLREIVSNLFHYSRVFTFILFAGFIYPVAFISSAGAQEKLGDLWVNFDYRTTGGADARLEPLGNDLMGDNVDKSTGSIRFNHTDVSLPGNSNLEVSVRRTRRQDIARTTPHQHAFGDWTFDLPIFYKKTVISPGYNQTPPTISGGCVTDPGSDDASYHFITGGGADIPGHTVRGGVILDVPGRDVSGFPAAGFLPDESLKDWKTKSESIDFNGNCATVMVAPDGTKYKFGAHVFRHSQGTDIPYSNIRSISYDESVDDDRNQPSVSGYSYLEKGVHAIDLKFVVFQVTEVEDIHGNYVRYEYTNDDYSELERIYSNDDREILVTYENPVNSDPVRAAGENFTFRNSRRIASISANGRTWNYRYTNRNLSAAKELLNRVDLPDGRFWEFGKNAYGLWGMHVKPQRYYKCVPYERSFQIKHPDGAIGTFETKETRHIRGATRTQSFIDEGGWDFYMKPMDIRNYTDNSECTPYSGGKHVTDRPEGWPVYRTIALKRKTISGPGIPTANWDFDYRNYSGGALDFNWTTVTQPDGTKKTYRYQAIGRDYGKLKEVDTVSPSGETLESHRYSYQSSTYGGARCVAGGANGDTAGVCNRYEKHPYDVVTYTRSGETLTTNYGYNTETYSLSQGTATYLRYTDKGRPNTITRSGTLHSGQRTSEIDYWHNLSANVIGRVKRLVRNGREMSNSEFDSSGQMTSQTRDSVPYYALIEYHSDGNIKAIENANGERSELHNWKHGKPQLIKKAVGSPDQIQASRVVDNYGLETASTDPMLRTTNYSRDNMGRLTLINPPGNRANTVINYDFTGGGAMLTITAAQSKETLTYDSMYRPRLEQTEDLSTGWSSYINTDFDALGRVSFKSQPSSSSTETNGIDFTYDGLGRPVTEDNNVTSGVVEKTYAYPDGYKTQQTNALGEVTTTFEDLYGDVVRIEEPEDRTTILTRNPWGQITAVRQKGAANGFAVDQTQTYTYDSQYRLCRHYAPEHGATKYEYDLAGQMVAYAKGQPNSGCTVPSDNARVNLVYDDLGRLKLTNFAHAGTPDIARTYDKNSNLKINRRGNGNSVIEWSYEYDIYNALTQETLEVDNLDFDIAYVYNTAGHLTRKTLPSGRRVNYTPDGLGRYSAITQSLTGSPQSLASGMSYHPSGTLASMNLGNGHSFVQTLNARLLPDRVTGSKGAVRAIDLTYAYDDLGRIRMQLDGTDSNHNRSFTYDGLGQLKTAHSPAWGHAGYTYDSLGNIRSKSMLHSEQSANISDTTRTLSYDARGNVTKLGALTMRYDISDQPWNMSGTGRTGQAAGGSYRYDGNLKRVKSTAGGKTIYNVYDASGSLVHIRQVTGGLRLTDYISGPSGTLARITKSGGGDNVTYLHADHLGSARTGTDSDGAIVWTEHYTPFGETLVNAAANDNQAGFTGHIKDSATGLNYMQARYYDPSIGRFLSIDPVGFMESRPGQFNRYSYTYNDPINKTDPTGMLPPEGMVSGELASGHSLEHAQGISDAFAPASEAGFKGMVTGLSMLPAGKAAQGTAIAGRSLRFKSRMNKVRQRLKGWKETKNRKGTGSRFQDPANKGNRVRVDKGNPKHNLRSQRKDHVVEQRGGKTVDGKGDPIQGPKPSKTEEAHVPLKDWLRNNK